MVADVDKDGQPVLQSSGVMVLDAATGNTLYSKNADHATRSPRSPS
jgi:D-alanyl-D-alanine carboxypeptidase